MAPKTIGDAMRRSAFVGRERELDVLHAARNRLARSHGGIVLIGGDPGIGKTRLTRTFLSASESGRPKTVIVTECLERDEHVLGPVRDIARELVTGGVPASELMRRFISGADGKAISQNVLFREVLGLIECAAQQRALIAVIDDLQWADASTLYFLSWLAARIGSLRVLIVATYRAEALIPGSALVESCGAILREPSTTSVELRGLDAGDVSSIVRSRLGTSDDATVARIVERSEGNPFFAEALARHFKETGDAAGLPLSVRALLSSRFFALGRIHRTVLTAAASIGFRFEPALLAEVAAATNDQVNDALDAARREHLVEDDRQIGWFRFRHPLTQQTIYETLADRERRELHGRALAALESHSNDAQYAETLLQHALSSGDRARIRRYGELAGENAIGMGGAATACRYFEAAVANATEDEDRIRLLQRLAAAQQTGGNLTLSIDSWRQAFHACVRLERFDDAARVLGYLIGDTVNHTARLDNAAADDFIERYGDRLSVPALNRLLAFLAAITSAAERFDEAQRYLDRIDDVRSLPPHVRQNALRAQLTVLASNGSVRAWREVAHQTSRVAGEIEHDEPFLAATAYSGIAATGLYLDAADEFDSAVRQAERLVERHRFSGLGAYIEAVSAARSLLMGNVPRAYDCATAVLRNEEVAVARQVLATVAVSIGAAAGDPALGADAMVPFLAAPDEEFSGGDGALLLAQRALFHLAGGSVERAHDDLRLAMRLIDLRTPSAITVFPVAAWHLPVDELRAILEGLPAIDPGNTTARATGALFRAIVTHREGRKPSESAAEAAMLFARLRWPLFEAQAWEAHGEPERADSIRRRCNVSPSKRGSESAPARNGEGALERLSMREREVALAIAGGFSNAAIAERLSVSKKTVEKHVASIFTKLGVRSRTEIATRAVAIADAPASLLGHEG